MREDVSDATHCFDVVAAAVGIAQLFADFADVHIDAAVEGRELPAENGIDQMLASDHASGFAQQHVQEIEFDRGQLHRFAILANDSSGGIKFNVTNPDDVGDLIVDRSSPLFSGLGATQNGTDAGNQFARIKRLGKIIVGANFQAYNSVYIFSARGKQQDRNPRRVPYSPQNVEAVHAGQHYIQHDQQVISIQGAIQTAVAVVSRLDLKTLGLKILSHQAAQLYVVVDYQNAIHFFHFSQGRG
jgi:hypothetical protein